LVRTFVTGANGFVGSNLVRRLLRDGHEVRALVRPSSDLAFLEGVPARLVRGDLSDEGALRAGARGADVFFHVAGLSSDWAPWSDFVRANLAGARNAADAAREESVPRFVHVSSATVHGFSGYRYRTEEDPVPPSPFPYVETKRRGERVVREILAPTGTACTVLRPGNVFGPRDRVTMRPMLSALEAGVMGVLGGGRRWTCPVYVENLVDAMLLAATVPAAAGRVYLVTDGLPVTWREFVDALARALDLPPPRLSLPVPFARAVARLCEGLWRAAGVRRIAPPLTLYRVANGGTDYHFSIARARAELGFEPRVGLDEACRRTVAWFRGN
jgi:nucleoside-diphosphate-sugar epimerase